MITRTFNPLELLNKNKSVLLLGPRGTGKTAIITDLLARRIDNAHVVSWVHIDLLQGGDFQRYLGNPNQLTIELHDLAKKSVRSSKIIVIIDEVQKIPALLDEVHYLIEKYAGQMVFLLSGSSARKLKRSGANLLAGRAVSCHLFTLSQLELDLSLSRAVQFGTLPGVYLDQVGLEIPTLESYVSTYLREEVQQESLIRGIDRFARFLDFAAQSNAQPINFSKLGRQLGVAGKTVAEYFSILCDTLVARELPGWSESVRRQLLQASKYYFFDCGVLNVLNGYLRIDLRKGGFVFGNLFETFVINQLFCANEYLSLGLRFYYWRDKDGQEVDLILARNSFEPLLAIEIKSHEAPKAEDCPGFALFKEDYPQVPQLCVCNTPRAYQEEEIRFLPWKDLIQNLKQLVNRSQ